MLTTNPPAKPEPLCDGIDDDGNGIIDDGCYSCEAGDFFQVGERQYCFDFENRPQSYAEAETICDLYDADLASYGGEDNTETRDNIIDIIAIHRSLWPRNLFGTLHGEPAGGNIILDECSALDKDYPDDPKIFSDPAKPGEHDHCSASVLAHFAYEPFGEPIAGLLEDGGFGDAFGVTCERAIPDRLLWKYAVSTTELQPNTWYHLAATWGPNGMRVYVI